MTNTALLRPSKPTRISAGLLKLHQVAPRIAKEGLLASGNIAWLADFDPRFSEFTDRAHHVFDCDCEMIAGLGRRRPDNKVDLLSTEIEPRAFKRKVRSIGSLGHSERSPIERERRSEVADGDVDVMNTERLHANPLSWSGAMSEDYARIARAAMLTAILAPANEGRHRDPAATQVAARVARLRRRWEVPARLMSSR